MAFSPYAGAAGRLSVAVVTPNLTVPTPPDLTAGVTAPVAGIRSWRINPRIDSAPIMHFESPADTFGVVWGEQTQTGAGSWTAEVEGYYDADTVNTSAKFAVGQFVEIDFIFSKGATFGRKGAVGKISALTEQTAARGDEYASFTATIEGHGALPAATGAA